MEAIRGLSDVKGNTMLSFLVCLRGPGSNDRRSGQQLRGRISLLLGPQAIGIRRGDVNALMNVQCIHRGNKVSEVTPVQLSQVVRISSVGLEFCLMNVRIVGRIVMNCL